MALSFLTGNQLCDRVRAADTVAFVVGSGLAVPSVPGCEDNRSPARDTRSTHWSLTGSSVKRISAGNETGDPNSQR
jgi:hypothetical protein